MTIKDFFLNESEGLKYFKDGDFVLAKEVQKDEDWDTVCCPSPGMSSLRMYLKKVSGDEPMEFFLNNIPRYRVFAFTNEKWIKFTTSNAMIEGERK